MVTHDWLLALLANALHLLCGNVCLVQEPALLKLVARMQDALGCCDT